MVSKRVLIVDDYADVLEVWRLYLRADGYEVATASDGIAAVSQALEFRPDVIVMDLELPGISGFEAARQLRILPATESIPLIAATGYSHVKQLNKAWDAGFDSIVIKPCEPDTLIREIERLVSQPRRDREHTREHHHLHVS